MKLEGWKAGRLGEDYSPFFHSAGLSLSKPSSLPNSSRLLQKVGVIAI